MKKENKKLIAITMVIIVLGVAGAGLYMQQQAIIARAEARIDALVEANFFMIVEITWEGDDVPEQDLNHGEVSWWGTGSTLSGEVPMFYEHGVLVDSGIKITHLEGQTDSRFKYIDFATINVELNGGSQWSGNIFLGDVDWLSLDNTLGARAEPSADGEYYFRFTSSFGVNNANLPTGYQASVTMIGSTDEGY